MFKKAAATPSAAPSSGCPVLKSGSSAVEAEQIDPTNMMPSMSQVRPPPKVLQPSLQPAHLATLGAPRQEPAAGQHSDLSKDRVESTIPKGDGGTWEYPSPQMFYNALRRKGKSAEGQEKHMKTVVAIHNNMNEITWKKVLEWEALHCDKCTAERKAKR